MGEERIQRKLAAILAADVAGYSRLMGDDEEATLAALTALRGDLVDPAITRHNGRIFKTTGDGFLAEFASVVDAVRCAAAIQDEIRSRNADVPSNRRLEYRIGINLGDVIVREGDVFGDGVNIAARLEALAEPGGICVSEAVFQQARNRLKLAFEDMGPTRVKNIAEPIRPYRAILREAGAAPRGGGVQDASPSNDKPSIAVLPFANLSSEAEQEYFSDGITEDVITDLSKIAGLFVIARNSTFSYKGKAASVPAIGRELGVSHVLEGSVRKAGRRVRVTAQLIDAVSGGHVWAERYDRDLDDIFAVQDEVTRQIVAALALHLQPGERKRLFERGTTNFKAYDLFLRGRELVILHSKAEGRVGQDLLRSAIELDSGFGKAHALLAFAHAHEFINRWVDEPAASLGKARTLADKAVALAPRDPECRWVLCVVLTWQRAHDRALEEARACIALGPNWATGFANLGFTLLYSGRPAEAVEALTHAMRLDPHYPEIFLYFLAQAQFNLEHFGEAEATLRRRLARNANSETTQVLLAATYGHQGRVDEARRAWREALRINPAYSFAHRRAVLPFKNAADLDRIAEGLLKAGISL